MLVSLSETVHVEPPESWSRTVTVPVGVTSPASSATLTVTVYACPEVEGSGASEVMSVVVDASTGFTSCSAVPVLGPNWASPL